MLTGEEGIRELTATGGADLVLNGVVGRGRARPDDRRPRRGHRRRPRQQGEPRDRRRADDRPRRGDRRPDPAGRLRALGALPADRLAAAGNGRAARAHGLRRPLPRPLRPQRRLGRGRARASHLADGRPDHDRLGDADEQGLRGDRGPPPVRRALRADRGRRPPAVDRPLADRPQRRRLARPPRPAGHAGPDLLRAALPRARRRRAAAASTSPPSASSASRSPTSRPSPACGWRARPARRGGRRRASSTPPTRSPSPPSSRAGSGSRRSPRRSSASSTRCRSSSSPISRTSSRPTRRPGAAPRSRFGG